MPKGEHANCRLVSRQLSIDAKTEMLAQSCRATAAQTDAGIGQRRCHAAECASVRPRSGCVPAVPDFASQSGLDSSLSSRSATQNRTLPEKQSLRQLSVDTTLVISCGGTGGHFFPGLSVARTLQSQGGEVLLLISGVNAPKQCAIARQFGIRAVELPRMPSPNRPKKALQFLHGLCFGTHRARKTIAEFRPNAALGMGSFTSLPVLAAAKFAGIPIYLHDGNARIGKANRILSRFACWLGTAFPAVNAERIHCPCEPSGMPLRPEILEATEYTKAQAIAELNNRFNSALQPDKPTILIFGGSQGAATLNGNIPQALRKIGNRNFQVLHLAGPDKISEVCEAYTGTPFPVLALPGTDAMELFYHAADLVISRSGGSTLAELLYFGKPAILVPYPYAAEGHQWDNARYALAHDAAVAIDDSQCTVEHIFELLSEFLENSTVWQKRAENARRLARPDATEHLLKVIAKSAEATESEA